MLQTTYDVLLPCADIRCVQMHLWSRSSGSVPEPVCTICCATLLQTLYDVLLPCVDMPACTTDHADVHCLGSVCTSCCAALLQIMYDVFLQRTGSPLGGIVLFALFPLVGVYTCSMSSLTCAARCAGSRDQASWVSWAR